MRVWTRLVLIVGLLFLSACTSTTFVYNRLDFLVPWYVDDYADLNNAQEKYLDELLVPFLEWHRVQELPRYVGLLEGIQTKLEGPIAAQDIAVVAEDIRLAWLNVEVRGMQWMLSLGEQMSDEQMDGFIEALWEQNKEYEEEYLERSDEEYFEDSYDNMHETAGDYLGRISKEQRRALEAASKTMMRADVAWLQEQADWIRTLEVLLEREEGWQQRVSEAVAARPQNTPENYKQSFGHNTQVIQEVTAKTLNSLTEKQAKHLNKKLNKLRADLEKLAAQG